MLNNLSMNRISTLTYITVKFLKPILWQEQGKYKYARKNRPRLQLIPCLFQNPKIHKSWPTLILCRFL